MASTASIYRWWMARQNKTTKSATRQKSTNAKTQRSKENCDDERCPLLVAPLTMESILRKKLRNDVKLDDAWRRLKSEVKIEVHTLCTRWDLWLLRTKKNAIFTPCRTSRSSPVQWKTLSVTKAKMPLFSWGVERNASYLLRKLDVSRRVTGTTQRLWRWDQSERSKLSNCYCRKSALEGDLQSWTWITGFFLETQEGTGCPYFF